MPALRQLLSSQWPVGASALLHGGVLALLLWHMNAPPTAVPDSGPLAVAIDFVVVQPPAGDEATPRNETPAPDPVPAKPLEAVETEALTVPIETAATVETVETEPSSEMVEVSPRRITTEDSSAEAIAEPPPVSTSMTQVALPPPPPPEAEPEVRPDPKPESKPIAKQRIVPPAKPARPSPPTTQAAVATPPTQDRPVLALPRPGAMIMPQQAVAVPLMPPVPVGPPVDYVGLVRQQLERAKQYPRAAQQRRLQGEVMLSILIDRGGEVLAFRLIKSSGHEILDREVAALVKRAGRLPPIPERMRTDRLEIVVPIAFLLQG